jgi:hypothetical protein
LQGSEDSGPAEKIDYPINHGIFPSGGRTAAFFCGFEDADGEGESGSIWR